LKLKIVIKINLIFDWRVKLKRKINLVKRQKNQKNGDQNWHKNKNIYFDWMVELKRIITLIKRLRNKLEIKTMGNKLKNIIPLIWIEWWNWKSINFYKNVKAKK